jgi:RNA polymerase sigma factor (sigma-70 family)
LFSKYSDKKLIRGIQRREDETLKYIYSAYYDMIRDLVLKNGGNISIVPDVFQESLIILYKQVRKGEIELSTDLKGYFFGIARMVYSNIMREKRRFSNLESEPLDETPSHYDNSTLYMERIAARAMEKLSPDCREVIELFLNKVPYSEIAIRLGLKDENYARRKKYLCKEALMELIKSDREYGDYQSLL